MFDEQVFFLLEFCGGGDLAKKIKNQNQTPFDLVQVLNWFNELSQAINYCHKKQVLHRDIKPANALLDAQDRVKLGDFGLCVAIESSGQSKSVNTGTGGYMAPEMYADEKIDGENDSPYDSKVDIFSIGATMFEVSNLKRAYRGTSVQVMAKLVMHKSPPEPYADHCPEKIKPILERCLALDPQNRPDSTKLIEDLQQALADLRIVERNGTLVRRPNRPPPPTRPVP